MCVSPSINHALGIAPKVPRSNQKRKVTLATAITEGVKILASRSAYFWFGDLESWASCNWGEGGK